jgi:hypothetical protein
VLFDTGGAAASRVQQPDTGTNQLLKILITRYHDDVQLCLDTFYSERSDYVISLVSGK